MIPLFPLIGSALLWGLLPFALGALWALWYFIEKSYRDGEIVEELTLWTDHIQLVRHGPRNHEQSWEANPYWVSLHLHPTGGPVKNYITLKGNGREVELGAFLSEDERPALHAAMMQALARAQASANAS